MNAGAFGGEMKDVVLRVRAIDLDGTIHTLDLAGMEFAYRHCGVPEEWIFLDVVLQGHAGDQSAIAERMRQIKVARDETQPTRGRTGGSTFANPDGARAWELIEQAGCRGLSVGGAAVSEKHCNFLLNVDAASAADIETLGEEIRKRVKEKSGHDLRWEIRRIGVAAGGH